MDIGASFMEIGGKSTTVYLTVFMKAMKDAPISHLLHCELRNAMALYFVMAISQSPPPVLF
jgi:hypothetical protein